MKGVDHRKKSLKRNGRTRYEKGRSLYHHGGKSWPLKRKKGDRANQNHNPEPVKATLEDVWPET